MEGEISGKGNGGRRSREKEGSRVRERKKREEAEKGRKGAKGEKEEEWKVAFWNVAGLRGKDEKFWRELSDWEVVVLSETWVDEREWVRIRGKLPRRYEWGGQIAKRKNRKGRAMGRMIMAVRKEIIERGTKIEATEEGYIEGRIRHGKEK